MNKLWLKYENWSKLENRALHVPVHVLEFCPECGLFCIFFFIFFYPIQLYTSYTPQNHLLCILKSQFYSIHLSLHVYVQKPFLNYFQTTLIWVITHTQPKHQDLLGFVLNPNSITCNLNHKSIQNYKIPSSSIPFLLFLLLFFFFFSSSSLPLLLSFPLLFFFSPFALLHVFLFSNERPNGIFLLPP